MGRTKLSRDRVVLAGSSSVLKYVTGTLTLMGMTLRYLIRLWIAVNGEWDYSLKHAHFIQEKSVVT
jgi:hypothetical protein